MSINSILFFEFFFPRFSFKKYVPPPPIFVIKKKEDKTCSRKKKKWQKKSKTQEKTNDNLRPQKGNTYKIREPIFWAQNDNDDPPLQPYEKNKTRKKKRHLRDATLSMNKHY